MKRILALAIFIIIIVITSWIFYREGSLAVNQNDKTSVIFVVKKGDTLDKIANNLANNGLIRNKIIFYLIVKQLGIDRSIQAGDFRLNPSMNAQEIAQNLTHGTLDNWVTIIEGLRKEEVAQVIGHALNLPEVEIINNGKEGYLFPDTYLLPTDATVETVLNILNSNFQKKYQEFIIDKAKKNNLTENQVVTLASLVEKEARHDADRETVAAILLKRLKNDWPLQIDATIQYALGYQSSSKTWWKKDLTIDDLKINSFYNTYKNQGLPPGPICNPGLSSLKAVVNADVNTPYWYYISDLKGNMHFAKTLEEHNANIQKYLQ